MPVGMYVPPARMTRSALMSTWPGADLGMKALAPPMMASCMILGSPTAETTTMGVVGAAFLSAVRQESPVAPGSDCASHLFLRIRLADVRAGTSLRHHRPQRIAVQGMVVGDQHPGRIG